MELNRRTILASSLALAFAGSAAIFAIPAQADDDVSVVVVTAQSRDRN